MQKVITAIVGQNPQISHDSITSEKNYQKTKG